MWIAKDNNLIILAKDTREELEQALKFMVYTSIEETEENYQLYNGQYLTEEQALPIVKESKIQQNDQARDEALLQGVTYREVLFDSDTDQKVNLLATVTTMGDEDTIVWFGMDNQPLLCTKLDLINIGGLITQLHSFCWNKNAEIKAEINYATTIEEVEAIEIDYTMPEPTEEITDDDSNE